MTPPKVLGADRRALPLGELVGRGGEGEVYAVLGNGDLVAKLYTGGRARLREDKVKAMLAAALAQNASLVSFPSGLLLDENGRFTGFLMRRVAKAKPLFQLYKPIARKRYFPNADYRFVVHVALNLAKAVASVHRSGCVIGDVNESGVLVTEAGKVALIDADSFQIVHAGRRFGCEVGKPEYTAPELQNRPLRDVIRTPDHDAFALAVLVFQLLWMGRHPFSGVYAKGEMPLEKAIGERRFAYSLARATGMSPPPGALPLSMFPAEVATAFESAFGISAARPRAEDWVGVLQRLLSSLARCRAEASHHYPASAKECPWCAARRDHGVQMFASPPLAVGVAPPVADWSHDFSLVEIWHAIDRVTPPQVPSEPTVQLPEPAPSARAKAAKASRFDRRMYGVLLMAAATGVIIWLAALWPVWLGLAVFGLNRLVGRTDESRFQKAFEAADRDWSDAVGAWRTQVGPGTFLAAKGELAKVRLRFEGLSAREEKRLQDAQGDRRAQALKAWLEQFQIRRSRIQGVGTSRVATLASFGIETAAEIDRGRLLRVPGFGPVSSQPLLDWRKRLEARFVYDPKPNAADLQRAASIRSEMQAEAAALRRVLSEGPAKLAALAGTITSSHSVATPDLTRLREARLQAEADLRYLGLQAPAPRSLPAAAAVPAPRVHAAAPLRSPAKRVASSTASPKCPKCQTVMTRRTARQGPNAGRQFWGCPRYPSCRGTRAV